MVEVKELVKKYGNTVVLDHISFSIAEGEILGLLGLNGVGKSTIMNIMTGNLAATEGTVTIYGHDILEEPIKAKKELGYLPETPPLYMDMTVKSYLNFVYRLKKCRLPEKEHIQEVCRGAQLEAVYGRVIKNLSKGYRQRIGIASALIGRPKVLVLDEPTSGLDPKQMAEIRQLIKELGEKHTIIFSSHILSEVQAVCNRVIVLNQRKVIADDTPKNLSGKLTGRSLRICVQGPAGEVEDALKGLVSVRNVERQKCEEEGCCIFHVSAKDGADIRRDISARIKQSDWLLLEMAGADLTLENVFLRLTNDTEGGGC